MNKTTLHCLLGLLVAYLLQTYCALPTTPPGSVPVSVPSVEELKRHFKVPTKDSCMFYTGGTMGAASAYAAKHAKSLIWTLDKDGWVSDDKHKDKSGIDDYAPDCPMSRAYQKKFPRGQRWKSEQTTEYVDNLCQAFSGICSGEILLSLPPSLETPANSMWTRLEEPAVLANTAITALNKIKLEPCNESGVTDSEIWNEWSR